MAKLTNSYSLTDFQRNAKEFIEGLNHNKEPLLITVNGKVQAILVDPVTYQQMEDYFEKERFISALREGLADIDQGRTRPVEEMYRDLKQKYGL